MPSRMGGMTTFLSFQGLSVLIRSCVLKELSCLFLWRVLAFTLPLNMSSQIQLSSFFHTNIYCLFKLNIEPLRYARPTTLTVLPHCPNSACASKASAPDLMICLLLVQLLFIYCLLSRLLPVLPSMLTCLSCLHSPVSITLINLVSPALKWISVILFTI